MEKIRLTLVFHLLTTSAFLYQSRANESREDLIEESVRRLLGLTPGVTRDTIPLGKNITLPPRYMMDLYEKYRSGQAPMQGNTVRSILPMRDTMGEADVLIFNLTGINSKERILKSELYILKRRKPRHGKRRDGSHFRMKIGSLPNMTFHRYIDISLSRQRSEWQSYDITNSVLHCRRSSPKLDSLLGITLEIKRSKNNYRLSPFRRLLKQNSQPFVLIFSEDDNQTRHPSRSKPRSEYDAIRELLKAKTDSGEPQELTASAEDSSDISKIRNKRSAFFNKLENTASQSDKKSTSTLSNIGKDTSEQSNARRVKHKTSNKTYILNHEKPLEESSFSEYGDSELSSGLLTEKLLKVLSQVSDLLLRKFLKLESKKTINEIQNYTSDRVVKYVRFKRSISSNKLAYSTNFKDGDSTANIFQAVDEKHVQPKDLSTSPHINRKENRKSKRRKKKRRNRKLPFWWTRHDSRLHSQDHKKMCQRRSLVVDFTKLGWGDWVMSPKSFNAHYCTGGCSFPLIKDTNPSNHAALQSLIHALGLNSNIPTPCCVPSATSPLTLLYFDEHGSLVLKNYPNMIVEKCACR